MLGLRITSQQRILPVVLVVESSAAPSQYSDLSGAYLHLDKICNLCAREGEKVLLNVEN